MSSISVIIPTHGRPDRLRAALSSVAQHGDHVTEVIVVDDGGALDPQGLPRGVRRLTQPHTGVSAARNRGIREAVGTFLYFLDDDDELQPSALTALLVRAQQQPPADVVFGRWRTVNEAGRILRTPEISATSACRERLAAGTLAPMGACLFRRSRVREIRGFDEELRALEDWDLFIRLAVSGARFRFVDRFVARYLDRPGSLSKQWDLVLAAGYRIASKAAQNFPEAPWIDKALHGYLLVETARRAHRAGEVRIAHRLIQNAELGCGPAQIEYGQLAAWAENLRREVERSITIPR